MPRYDLIRFLLFAPALIAAAPAGPITMLVAARPIARGALIAPADVVAAPAHGFMLDALVDAQQAVGQIARRAIAPGVTLRADALQSPALVHRGDPVTLRVARAGFTVEARGQAAADGGAGDAIPAINSATGTRLRGAVSDAGIISIDPLKSRASDRNPQ